MTPTPLDYVELSSHWANLIKKKWLILSVSFLLSFLCMTYALFKPKQYQSSVLLHIHPSQRSSLGNIANSSQTTYKDNISEEPIAVLIALIRSRYILEPAIKSLHLADKRPLWIVMNDVLSRLHIIDLAGSTENTNQIADILQMTLNGKNAKETIQLINQIALFAQSKDRERKIAEAKKTLEFLYNQLPIVQDALKKSEIKWNQYRFNNNNMDPKMQVQYLFNHLSDIEKQLEMIRIKKIALMQEFTNLHPDVIALNETNNALQKQRNEILAQIKTMTQANQTGMNLAREVDVNKNLYMKLLDKIHSEQVITAGIVSDISILSLASSSEVASGLKPGLLGLAGLLIGLMLSSLGVLVWQIFKRPEWGYLDFNPRKEVRNLAGEMG